MEFQIHDPFNAFRLDEEGDPIGELVEFPPGAYRARGGFSDDEEYGGVRIWLEPAGTDELIEARGVKFNG